MSIKNPDTFVKVAKLLHGTLEQEELEKIAGLKSVIKSLPVGRALKATGIVGTIGAAAGIGSITGERRGRKKQFSEDVPKFRAAAAKIYGAGQRVGAGRVINAIRSRLNNSLKMPRSNKSHGQNVVMPMIRPPEIPKHGYDRKALAVYDGWRTGQIKTAAINNLPPTDLAKIAAVIIDKMDEGDRVAEILWNVISS